MKTYQYSDHSDWMNARIGKITGSKLKGIVTIKGKDKKIGFYELIAEKLGVPADDESAMDRGTRLEEEAIEQFAEVSGKNVDTSLILWARDDNENIAISPDGFIGEKEAVEAKCLSSARHIEALINQEIPKNYKTQMLQYFCVNDKLKTLHFVFYDPRILAKPLFTIQVHREDVQEDVDKYLEYQRTILAEVEQYVLDLSNF